MKDTLASPKLVEHRYQKTPQTKQSDGIKLPRQVNWHEITPTGNKASSSVWKNFFRSRSTSAPSQGAVTDLLLCTLCFLVIHRLYLGSFDLTPERLIVFIVSPLMVLIWLASSGSLSVNRFISLGNAISRVVAAWILALMTLAFFVYFTKLAEPVSRGWIALSMISSLFALLAARVTHFAICFYRLEHQQTSVVIVGSLQESSTLAELANNDDCQLIDVKAIFSQDDDAALSTCNDLLADQLLTYIEKRRANSDPVHQVWISPPAKRRDFFESLNTRLLDSSVDVCIVLNDYEVQLVSGSRTTVVGVDIVNMSDVRLPQRAESIKRIFDFVFASAGLVLLFPILTIVALVVKFDSRGPILFKQKRFGLDGREIEVWKFRTMFHSACKDISVRQATRNDSRITRIGGLLRRTSLDELPQLFNVLQGHMSLVGPRPHAVEHSHKYRELVKGYMLRHKIKPGITGWAQVNGWRGETDTLEKMQNRIKFDVAYIRNWSLWLDIQIVARTALMVFFDRNAY